MRSESGENPRRSSSPPSSSFIRVLTGQTEIGQLTQHAHFARAVWSAIGGGAGNQEGQGDDDAKAEQSRGLMELAKHQVRSSEDEAQQGEKR